MSVAGLERMTTGSVAKRLILSRHTGSLNSRSKLKNIRDSEDYRQIAI